MKNKLIFAGIAGMGLLVMVAPAFAASAIVLRHAGIGQRAGDTTSFGVAICNNGTQAVSGVVPFRVSANGKTVNATVNGALAAGGCQYTYLTYSSFNMTVGVSYSVSVAIDPNHTVTTNVDAPATYMLSVPGSAGKVLGASTSIPSDQSSQMLTQLASMEAMLQQLLAQLAGK